MPITFRHLCCGLLIALSSLSYSQNDSILSVDEMYNIKYDRQLHIDFHKSMNSLRRPSTISSLTNFRHHIHGYQKKPFIMDGDLNLPIAIKGPKWGKTLHTFQVIPRFQFRIFQNDEDFPYGKGDTSNPVRTPSAMPGFAWYMTLTNLWEDSHDPINDYKHDIYWGIYAYHHSNGQDGEELDISLPNTTRVNLYNGNFGEQLVFEPTIGGRIHFVSTPDDDIKGGKRMGETRNLFTGMDRVLYWQFSYEWRPDTWTNEVFDTYNIYGKNRVKFLFTLQALPTLIEQLFDGKDYIDVTDELRYERRRHTLELNYIVDNNYASGNVTALEDVGLFDVSKRLNINYTFHFIPYFTKNLGLFAKLGYTGSDEYNIYFQDSFWHSSIGFSFAFFDQPEWQNINDTNF